MTKDNLFYFDIETVGEYKDLNTFRENDKRGYDLYLKRYKKSNWMRDGEVTLEEAYLNNAPIVSTYGKIVCVSFGYFHTKNENGYSVSSIYNDDEYILMKHVQDLFMKVSQKGLFLSGYNINIFDIPWLVHKLNKYKLNIPPILRIYGKKPWEIKSFDLFNEWKSTFNRNYTSFDEVCYELDVPSPKDTIDGSQVHGTYWEKNDLNGIVTYCEKDVYSSMLVAEKMLLGHNI